MANAWGASWGDPSAWNDSWGTDAAVVSASVTETANALDALDAVAVSGATVIEAAEAVDTLDAVVVAGVGISEAAEALDALDADVVSGEGVISATVIEAASAIDVLDAAVVPGEVVQPPVSVGGGYYRPPRPYPVIGYGYGILPELTGEAHGVVVVAGAGAGTLPRLTGEANGSIGIAGRSVARLHIKAAAIGVRGQVGAAAAELKCLVVSGLGAAGSRGSGAGVLVTIKGAARGRHDDDEAAMVAFLLAA